MSKEKDKPTQQSPVRVIRGGEGDIVGYWFPEDFLIYQEYLLREQTQLLEEVRALPLGTNFSPEMWLEMRRIFEAFAQKTERPYTHYDVTSSTAYVQEAARGVGNHDKNHH